MTINEWMIANDADFGHDNATFVYRKVVITIWFVAHVRKTAFKPLPAFCMEMDHEISLYS